jgi:hypothetical protein
MQASHLNKIIFHCILYLGIWQNAKGQIDTKQISKADSLFKTNQLLDAEKIYLQFNNPRYKEIENVKLKLAFIAKEKNDWANEIFYLSSIQAKNASPSISRRLNQIGHKQQLGGYEIDFLDQLTWVYFTFFPYLMGFMLCIAMYVAIILIYKKQNNRKSPSTYIYSLSLYLVIIFLIANFPSFLNFGIITKNKAYLREFSSSAAPVAKILSQGNRITHWYTKDIWTLCFYEGNVGYIKTEDYLPIN